MDEHVVVDRQGGLGRVRLNRPRAINALSAAMIGTVADALAQLAADDTIRAVELTGVGERGLCSGVDVRELRELVLAGGDVRGYFATEYRLDLAVAGYPKPYRAVMTGLTMGGGMGLSVHARERVVDASSRLAMPETLIGLFPDVFVTHLLARMPGEVGTHLALTGASVTAADAIRLGWADRCVGPLPEPDPLLAADWVAECYVGDDAAEMVGRLAEHREPDARATAAHLARRAPLALAVTVEALRRAAGFATLADQYEQELTLAVRLTATPDFVEGVRAQLVDKDRTPHWSHASVAEVTRAEVLACFEPLP